LSNSKGDTFKENTAQPVLDLSETREDPSKTGTTTNDERVEASNTIACDMTEGNVSKIDEPEIQELILSETREEASKTCKKTNDERMEACDTMACYMTEGNVPKIDEPEIQELILPVIEDGNFTFNIDVSFSVKTIDCLIKHTSTSTHYLYDQI
jgi:hypothetical protein